MSTQSLLRPSCAEETLASLYHRAEGISRDCDSIAEQPDEYLEAVAALVQWYLTHPDARQLHESAPVLRHCAENWRRVTMLVARAHDVNGIDDELVQLYTDITVNLMAAARMLLERYEGLAYVAPEVEA